MRGIARDADFKQIKRRDNAVATLLSGRLWPEADRQTGNQTALDHAVNGAGARMLHVQRALDNKAVRSLGDFIPCADKVIRIVTEQHLATATLIAPLVMIES